MKKIKHWILLFLLLTNIGLFSGCRQAEICVVQMGMEEMLTGNFAEALLLFEEAIEMQQYEELAWRGIGLIRFRMSEFEEAAFALQTALDLGGEETPIIYHMIGSVAMRRQDYETAINSFTRGVFVGEQRSMQGVAEEMEAAIVMQEMRFNLVVLYQELREWEIAREYAIKYLVHHPDCELMRREMEFLESR